MRGGRLSCGPFLVEACSVGQVDIEPSVLIVIEERDAATFGFDDVALMVLASPDVRDGEPGLAGYVDELNGRFGRRDGVFCDIIACGEGGRGVRPYTNGEAAIPSPERSGEGV